MNVQGMEEQFCRGGSDELFHALGKGKWGPGKGEEEVITEMVSENGEEFSGQVFRRAIQPEGTTQEAWEQEAA